MTSKRSSSDKFNEKIIFILFSLWLICLLILVGVKSNYKPQKYLELSFSSYSCTDNRCDIAFNLKNVGVEKDFSYFITASIGKESRYILKQGSVSIQNFDEKMIKETVNLSNYSQKQSISSNWKYEIHFYEGDLRVSVEFV